MTENIFDMWIELVDKFHQVGVEFMEVGRRERRVKYSCSRRALQNETWWRKYVVKCEELLSRWWSV